MDAKTLNSVTFAFYALIIYVAGVIAVCLVTPHTFSLSQYKLPPSEVYLKSAAMQIVPNRFVANPSDTKMSRQFMSYEGGPRRFHFKFDEDWPVAGARTIYIPSSGGETRVFISGAPMPVSEKFQVFAPGLGTDWVSFDISRQLLVPGSNRLDIHLQSDPAHAGIREIYIAPRAKALRVIRQQKVWVEMLPIMAAIGAGFLVLLSLGGLAYGRDKKSYLIIGCLGSLLLFQAGLSFIGAVEPFKGWDYRLRIILPLIISGLLIVLWRSDVLKWRGPQGLKLAAYLLSLTGPVLTLAAMTSPLFIAYPLQITTFALAGPLLLLLPKSIARLRADLALRRSRIEELRAKVSQQAEELDEKSQVIAGEMQKRAVLEERQRFTRDIHDGIGGQLLSLLLRVRTGRVKKEHIAEEIQQGLNDLRLVVDSMDHTGDDLNSALTTFRMRAENQMKAAEINFSWQQSERLFVRFPTSRGTLVLYRFMQEALTNIVRHAKANRVEVVISQPEETGPLTLQISDNGIGLPESAIEGPGKGLQNLMSRAKLLGGTLTFSDGIKGKGVTVELIIPSQS